MKVSVEQMLYGSFIKYNAMQRMTEEAFSQSNADSVNVYVDLNSLFKPLYNFAAYLTIENYTSITSSIINLCAHIRGYYDSRHRVSTKIFLINSYNIPSNSKLMVLNYNIKNETTIATSKIVTNLINSNMELLDILCPYLHDIFFINIPDNAETAVAMYDIICKQEVLGNTDPNIVLTKDLYMYQLPAIHRNTVLFRVLKSAGEDYSYAITHPNSLNRFIKDSRSKDDEVFYNSLSPELLSLLMALTNLSCRSIKSIFTISKGINIIIQGINNKILINGYNSDIENIINSLDTVNVNKLELIARFKAIDLLYQHSIYKMSSSSATNMDKVINLYDPNAVRAINNIYFKENPLDLNRI